MEASLLEAESEWTPLVPARVSGSEPPLFVVHDVGGEPLFVEELARLLPQGFPIYGLRGQALEGRMIPERSLEELAARYVEAVRLVRPHGPYRLYGSSAGGTIAFEMARQLGESGEDVPLLVLGDSMAPGASMKWGRRERAVARVRELRHMSVAEASGYVMRIAARQVAFAAHRATARVTGAVRHDRGYREASEELMQAAAAGGPAVPVSLRSSFAVLVYGWMTVAYVPESAYDGRVTVLRCSESAFAEEPWNRYVTAPAVVVPVPGRHVDLGAEAIAAALATELTPC